MTRLAPWASNGSPYSNYVDWFDFRPTWPTFSEILNTVAWNFFFKILTLPTPLGLKWGPKLNSCWLIWFSTNMTNVLWNFEHSSLKNKIFKILTLLPPPGLKWDPKPKFCWLIWFSTHMTNVLWNFQHSSLKNKIFKILIYWGRGAQKGSLNWKFFIHYISAS